jgi:hypothetical protein
MKREIKFFFQFLVSLLSLSPQSGFKNGFICCFRICFFSNTKTFFNTSFFIFTKNSDFSKKKKELKKKNDNSKKKWYNKKRNGDMAEW